MWNESAGLLKEFAGEGMVMTLFLLAIIWLLVTEKRKEIRIVFVYMPITVLAVFMFPLTAKILDAFLGEEIYYRLLADCTDNRIRFGTIVENCKRTIQRSCSNSHCFDDCGKWQDCV